MKILFYLLPCVMNLVMGLFFFITARRLAVAGNAGVAVAGTMAVWACVYTVVSGILGTFQNRRNAVRLILIGEFILIGAILGLLFFSSLRMQYVWLLLTGVGTACFFAPFQVVVKALEPDENATDSLARSSALYTFSWSSGFATGPLIAALIWGLFAPDYGWIICYWIAVGILIGVVIVVMLLGRFLERKDQGIDSDTTRTSRVETVPERTDLVYLGWIFGGMGFATIAVVRTNIPYYCTRLDMSTTGQGLLLATISYVLCICALFFVRSRSWMYRPGMYLISGSAGVVSLCVFGWAQSYTAFQVAAVGYGLYAGVFCFVFVYHALANPRKSARYVAVNEVLVGATGVLLPLFGGWVADRWSGAWPFRICAILTIFSMFYVYFVLKKVKTTVDNAP